MDGASTEILRIMQFVLDTQSYCLKMQPKDEGKEWDLVPYYNNDWAGGDEKRLSVTAF